MATYSLKTPIREEDIRVLRVGDILYLSGVIVTARDAAHRRIIEYLRAGKLLPVSLKGGVIYHCGPVVARRDGTWEVLSAGPTTSTRLELYESEVVEKTGVKLIIGKGGMGPKTAEACSKHGAVYAIFTGGAAVLAAQAIRRVISVEWLDLGIPEALWILEVENFGPLIVAIDTTGRNYIEEVMKKAEEKLRFLGISPTGSK
ncbi:MAG: FumA C-terminus/TtdB family hydratase beta subunit [Sulfolobales archaeon]|nr:FumA C-terminus/TtdB family hydratase beta subunit [Sulfolobales archaeon]